MMELFLLFKKFNFNKKPTLEKYIEAKKCDDFIFENRDFDD